MSTEYPAELTIQAIIRDFRANHPDFETDAFTYRNLNTPLLGAVEAQLGPNGKPTYRNVEKLASREESFQQWFNDTPKINTSLNVPITLHHQGNGQYKLEDDNFFPIDGRGFGNLPQEMYTVDGNGRKQPTAIGREVLQKNTTRSINEDNYAINHNFHFTLEATHPFVYLGDESLSFYGEDDLWIFIDGKLVIDLGGLHSSLGKEVDLSLTNPKNRAIDKSTTLTLNLKDDLEIDHARPDLSLELKVGKTYDLHIFFAERHTEKSVFHLTTSLRLLPAPPLPAAKPTVGISASHAPRNGSIGEFHISLSTNPPAGGLRVKYDIGQSTAVEGRDFTLSHGSGNLTATSNTGSIREVTIASSKEVFIEVHPISGAQLKGKVTIELYSDPTYEINDAMKRATL